MAAGHLFCDTHYYEPGQLTMTSRSSGAALASHYDEMPLSLVLFRYLWPFWLFKDASRGDGMTRAAAYRHNRSMRIYLPGYLMKWMFSCVTTFGITAGFGSLSTAQAASTQRSLDVFAIIAAGWGIIFACSVCVLFITSYIYFYLSRYDA